MIRIPLDVMPLRGTFPRWRRACGALLVAVFIAPVVAGCGSGKEVQVKDRMCDVPASSEEGHLLRQILGATEIETSVSRSDGGITERMLARLREDGFQGFGASLAVCSFKPESAVGASRLAVEFLWVARDESERKRVRLDGPTSHYNINGAPGEANDITSRLRVECRLGGDSGKLSKRFLLQGRAGNTLLMGTKVEQETKDRQVAFLYLLLRRGADIIGCENDPLAKDPVVKAYDTASEAAAAGSADGG